VGKVPDPKSQVEQITIALIYKFMDDMDAEAEEMDGKRGYFVGEYEKFSWAKLLNPALSGYEMLSLYAEAMEKMTRNQGVPQLFRDIFKNAYLPYRDPETLKLFLKTINEFTYDHSERLGDAFEYLLSVLGSQGDAGQFRTPRHIIDFMVKVVDPKKDETILDPACGTAGFLISAFKHILASNSKDGKPGSALTPEDRKKLANNIRGYDISPDMVRLSLVNLYLHGFSTPHIYEYDTLTSEERWNEYADVILANPPFMSPKGGIKPHKRFSVQSNRSEVLFVDYMAEHLTMKGRAAIIVPEGIIFQSAGAYKQLRKYLVEQNYLWAVVSLPAGVFNPYAGVKTSILFLDRNLAKKTDQILFVKVEADGFDLGAQRRPIDRNDLPEVLKILNTWKHAVASGDANDMSLRAHVAKQSADSEENPAPFGLAATSKALLVSTSRLVENGDYNLSADRYREVARNKNYKWNTVLLSDLCESILSGGTPSTKVEKYWEGKIPWITSGDIIDIRTAVPKRFITQEAIENSATNLIPKGNIIVVTRVGLGKLFLTSFDVCISQDSQGLILKTDIVLPEYLLYILSEKVQEFKNTSQGSIIQGVTKAQLANLQIPLPPLDIQRQIVDEIAAHQNIIDGARQVAECWKPNIEIDGEWEQAKIGDVCDFIDYRGKTPNKAESGVRLITAKNVKMGYLSDEPKEYIADYDSWMTRGIPKKGDVLFTTEGPLGNVAIIDINDEKFAVGQRIITLQSKDGIILPGYLANVLMSQSIQAEVDKYSTGSTVKGILARYFRDIEIPLPPLDIQREIVDRIERERAIVEGNRELIKIYEEKVKKVIERVWEG
jgi:type I restriction enzyme M protein